MNTEISWYIERLEQLRDDVRQVLLGLDSDGLNWKPIPDTTNSIYMLAQQCVWVEQAWISQDMTGQPFPNDWLDNENLEGIAEDAADLLFWLDEAATATACALTSLDSAALDEPIVVKRNSDEFQRMPRAIIVHVIEQYAECLGTMRLMRQLWEAQRMA